jgi:hypothetical protein
VTVVLDGLVTWELLLAAFAGGAFGAAIGALPSFSLCGLFVVVGELYELVARTVGVEPLVDITGSVAFGPVLGPHVAFGGGAAAVAYAAGRDSLDAEFEYHDAKLVTRGLGTRPDVLVVGGCFGMFGHLVAQVAGAGGLPTDPVALGVVLSALAHRVVFGYSLIGAAPGRLFDMSPFERGQTVPEADQPVESVQADGGHARYAVEPWLPYQYRWSHVLTIGLVVGILGGYLAVLTGSAFLAFGLSVVALIFVNADVAEIPVTHHMALPASTVVLASVPSSSGGVLAPSTVTAAVPMGEALLLGALFGAIGALAGEVLQRVFYAHAETHLDPPAASIVVTSLLIAVLAWAGLLPGTAWIPA